MSGQPQSPTASQSHRGISFDTRPTVGGVSARGYDINSRHSSFASNHSTSSRKNSIAEVGIRISFA
jgi:hypothetical protein